jgi:hypothetical protein
MRKSLPTSGFRVSSTREENGFPANPKGFAMTFANGWTVSVQFGRGNYCDNLMMYSFSEPEKGESSDAEIVAWDKEGNWFNFGNDTVAGYQSPDKVLAFMNKVANFPKGKMFAAMEGERVWGLCPTREGALEQAQYRIDLYDEDRADGETLKLAVIEITDLQAYEMSKNLHEFGVERIDWPLRLPADKHDPFMVGGG